MDATIDYLASHVNVEGLNGFKSSNATVGATVGMLWIDVEGTQVGDEYFSFFFNYPNV